MTGSLRLGMSVGTAPDKWVQRYRERHGPLDLVQLASGEGFDALREGRVDAALLRTPARPAPDAAWFAVRLYEEPQVVVAAVGHLVEAADEVLLEDLVDEQLVLPHPGGWQPSAAQLAWPETDEGEAVRTVAAGTGVVLLPAPVARLHARKDVVVRPVPELEPSHVALWWRRDRDGADVQALVGVLRGRTAGSSR